MQQIEGSDHLIQRWQQAIWLLIALLTPLFVNFWVEQQFEASKVWLVRSLIWILLLLWLGGRLFGLRSRPLSPLIRILITTLFLILILATSLSVNQQIAIFGTIDRANGLLTQLSYLLLFICVATQITPQSSRQLLIIIVFTAVPICLLGLAQAVGWQPVPLLTDSRSLITTTLGRANFTGAYLAMVLPLTLAAAQLAHHRNRRIMLWSLALVELIIILLTQARAAWVATIVAISLYLWLQAAPRWSRRMRLATIVAAFVLRGAVGLLFLERGLPFTGSVAARLTIWQTSIRLLWPRLWLGYGADTLELIFPAVYPPQLVYYQGRGVIVDRAHNWLLDYSLSYGIAATIIILVLIALIFWQGWRQLTKSANNEQKIAGEPPLESLWLVAAMAAAGAFLVGNLFLFEVAATAVVFWLLLAVVNATSTNRRPKPLPINAPLWLRKTILVSAVFIIGWAIWQSNIRPLEADFHSWRGTQALNQGRSTAAVREFSAATNQQPRRSEYHTALAFSAAQEGSFEQAEAEMLSALALRPGDPQLYTQLALIYGQKNNDKIEQAYAAYDHALTLAPTIALTYQQYAGFALRNGDFAKAAKLAERAVDLDATDGLSFGIAAWAYLQVGNLPAAQGAFEQAVYWQPNSADFHLGLATVYFQQGRLDAARAALGRSLIIAPDYAPALALQFELQKQKLN